MLLGLLEDRCCCNYSAITYMVGILHKYLNELFYHLQKWHRQPRDDHCSSKVACSAKLDILLSHGPSDGKSCTHRSQA